MICISLLLRIMGKKVQKRKTKSKPEKKAQKVGTEKEEPDYGGLPSRDLKKNLGCG